MQLLNLICFWFKVFILIPCVGCCIFILHYSLTNRTFRRALNNHVIIVIVTLILIMQLTDVLWILYFNQFGTVLSPTPIFCRTWKLIDYYSSTVIVILVGWASIERHILIFHDRWVSTRRRRLLSHYLPLIFCVIYPLVFYIITFYILTCDISFDYTSILCGYRDCLSQSQIVFKWDSIVHYLIPIPTVVIFSIGLLIRVLWQKRRLHQRIRWRYYRKMTIQLLSIAAVYFIFYLPPMLLYVAYTFGLSFDVGTNYYLSSWSFMCFTFMLIPIVFAISLSKFRSKFKRIFRCCQRPTRAVGPVVWASNHAVMDQPVIQLPITK